VSVVGVESEVLAAAAADADEHLSVGASVALAYCGVDHPTTSEVEGSDCPGTHMQLADDDRVVSN